MKTKKEIENEIKNLKFFLEKEINKPYLKHTLSTIQWCNCGISYLEWVIE